MTAIGDLARMIASRHQHDRLSRQLTQASVELSTGVVQDKTRHLRGDTKLLTGLDRDLTRLGAFDQSIKEGLVRASSLQLRLERVTQGTEDLVGVLTRFSSTPLARREADIAAQARATLDNAIQQLNAKSTGSALFSGTATDRSPLPSSDAIVTAIRQIADTGGNAESIVQAVDNWLDAPDGFLAEIYGGATSDRLPVTTAEGQSIQLSARADDPALRQVLAYSALAVAVAEGADAMPAGERKNLYDSIASRMAGAQDGITEIQANLGLAESRLEQALSRQEAERFAIKTMRNELIGADRFTAATKLQAIQQNLESLYAATARSAQLSFAGFLR